MDEIERSAVTTSRCGLSRPSESASPSEAVFGALDRLPHPIVCCFPNADAGSRSLIDRAQALCVSRSDARLVVNLPAREYWSLLSVAHVLIGNSSSGVMEAEVWPTAAEDLAPGPGRFDIVTCLWNVLGAIDGQAQRLEALTRMRDLLAPDGRVFVDVHNRYYARTAGPFRVLARRVRDGVWPSDANGSVTFTWRVAGEQIASRGHLFTTGEMRRLTARSGLRTINRCFIDYGTGNLCARGEGQMLFELAKD